jgi:hypothetical protein
MHAGVTGSAKGNQEAALMDPWAPVVDGELPIGPTNLAATTVAVEDSVAVAGKAAARMSLARVATPAQTGGPQLSGATGTEMPGLPIPR